MKHTWKKAAAFVLASALVAGVAPANVGTGGLYGGTGIVAYAADVQFSNASVTLGDDLALNFYVDGIANDTEATEYTVNFTGACVDESSALTYNATEGKYYATTHVYAKDIYKNITATLCKGSDTVDTLEDYSISQYLAVAAGESPDAETDALIDATTKFGYASAEYFYGDDYGVTATFADYDPVVADYAPNFTSDDALLSLVLDSKTAARLYVKGDTTGAESNFSSTKADYPTYHEVTGLLPQNLADEQTITVGGTDYKFSALSWCSRVLTNGSATEKNVNMAKAIVAYYTAAKNYTTVDVTSVTLNQSTLTLAAIGDTATLTATVSPDTATDKTVTWESSNTTIATVDENGKVTAIGVGEATITAKAGDKTATCSVNSLGCSKASYTISSSSSKPISFDNGNVTYTSSGSYIISKNATNKFTANGGRKLYKIVLSGKSIESRASGTGWSRGTWSSSDGATEVTFNSNWNYNNNNAGIGLTMTVYYK